jgi:hypothetical protein
VRQKARDLTLPARSGAIALGDAAGFDTDPHLRGCMSETVRKLCSFPRFFVLAQNERELGAGAALVSGKRLEDRRGRSADAFPGLLIVTAAVWRFAHSRSSAAGSLRGNQSSRIAAAP